MFILRLIMNTCANTVTFFNERLKYLVPRAETFGQPARRRGGNQRHAEGECVQAGDVEMEMV